MRISPIISAKDIAVSGMKVQRRRMDIIANNVANVGTLRDENGQTFRRQLTIIRGNQIHPYTSDDKFGVSVKRIERDMSPLRQVFDPGHPDANEDGYVSYPNVNVSVEMVDLLSAQRAYEANVSVYSSSKRIAQKALEIIQA